MIWFPNLSTIVTVGGVTIRWYAVTVTIGIIFGFLFLSKSMKEHGYQQRTSDDLVMLSLVAGTVGGRIGWVIENWKSYSMYAWDVLSIFDGGTEIITAAIGISIGIYLYAKVCHMSFRRTSDIAIMALMYTAAIASIGRAFENPKTLIVTAAYAVSIIVIYLGFHNYRKSLKRGDIASIGVMLIGMIKLGSYVFKLDSFAVNCLWFCILAEVLGLATYIFNRSVKDTRPVILFDFDGTIMDSERMIIGCYAYLFHKFSNVKEFTRDKQLEVLKKPLKEEVTKLFPDQMPELMVKEYKDFMKSLPGRHLIGTMPHASEVIKELKQEGYVLGVVTSRLTESCMMWIEDLGLEDCFGIVLGTERIRHMKPAPDGICNAGEELHTGHDSCIYIGDNVSDVEFGKNAGVYTVGFISSKEKEEDLKAAKPNETIKDMQELLEILKEEHAWSYTKI